jgi:two-component system sensor histidine kinase ChiS
MYIAKDKMRLYLYLITMRINCQLHYLLLFVVCLASALQAQPLSEQFPSSSPTPSVRFEHVTIEDGLSDNRINGFLQDSEGYMWFGSQDGLNRFDGYQFTSFWHDARDSTSLSGNYIEVLFEDHEQTMWVGTWGSGLNRYDRKTETFEHLRHDPDDPASLADDFISAIVEDTNGTLWIGTENGLSRFEAATGSFTTYRHDPDDEGSLLHNIIRSLLVDREGVLWAGTGSQFSSPLDEGGLNRYDAATNSFIRYPGDAAGLVGHHVVAMFEDRAGTLWVGTASGGIHRMDKVAGTFEPVAPALRAQSYLTFMHEDRLGRFWVGTASGVNLVDRGTGSFTSFLPDPADPASLATGRVWRIYEDRSGTLWIGCGGSGCLEKVMTEPKPFRHYPFFSGGGFYDPMYELRNGTLLLAANQIDMFDKERGHLVTHPDLTGAVLSSGATIDAVITFCEDSSGLIWIGGDRLLLAYNPDTRQVKDYASALFQSYENVGIWSIREAPDGMIWFAAGTYGLLRFDPASGETGTFNRVETLPEPISIHINSDGTMWVGTFGRGLCLFDPGTN